MKDRRITIVATCTAALFAPAAVAQTVNEFEENFSQSWHDFRNWSEGHVPTVTEFALISYGNTCIISTQDGVAGAVGVEDTATLRVSEGYTLKIVTPSGASPLPALRVEGLMWVENDNGTPPPPAKILFEHLGTNGVSVVEGGGTINGDPGTFDYTGSNEPDHVRFDSLTIAGTWTIPVDLENDGTFAATGRFESMTFFSGDCTEHHIEIGGNGLFITDAGGSIDFVNPEFQAAGNTFTGTLKATGSVSAITLDRCTEQTDAIDVGAAHLVATNNGNLFFLNGIETDGAMIDITSDGKLWTLDTDAGNMTLVNTTVTVDGGLLHAVGRADLTGGTLTIEGDGIARFYQGLVAENGDISICENGRLRCYYSELVLDDNALSICDYGRVETFGQDVKLQGVAAILIQDDASLECDRLYTSSPTNIDLTVTGGTLECVRFDLTSATLIVSGGEFHLIGDTLWANLFESSTLTLSGGTLYLGGTFDGTDSSTVTVSGGTLDIRGDNRFEGEPYEDFYHLGTFSFTGGKIKVKDERKVLID